MAVRPTLVALIALSLLAPAFLAGAQAANNTTEEETDDNTTEEETYEDDGSESWVDCWDDEHGASCEAVASTREEAYNLLEEAEADGRMPFSLDDDNVQCQEETYEYEVSVHCFEEEERTHVKCWGEGDGASCEAMASTREEAYNLLEEAAADGRVPFSVDDEKVQCQEETGGEDVFVHCFEEEERTHVECWDDHEGLTCEAVAPTVEDARALLRESDQVSFELDDPNVRCEEEQHDREAIVFCFEEPEHEDPDYDERHDTREGPGGEPDCTPLPDEGIVKCAPPPECEGQLGEIPQCQPPSECEIVGPNTVTCPMGSVAEAGGSGPHPDCEPAASDPNAMVCTPPSECEGKIGETAACTPPPECEPHGDGTFLCKLEGGHEARGDTAPSHEDERDSSVVEGLDDDLRDAVREALDGFREELQTLRSQYQEGKADLAERYEQTKDELREEYRACLDELGDDAERVEVLEKELACKKDARAALEEEREVLLAERDLLREDLLSQAETKKFQTCQSLQESLHSILMDHGIFESDLGAYLSPADLGLCAGILIDQEIDTGDIGDWGGGEER